MTATLRTRTRARAEHNLHLSSCRDKRYTIPVLWAELFENVYETQSWSLTHIILKDYDGPLKAGMEFSAVFTFQNRKSFGIFNGRVARCDLKRKLLGAEIAFISKESRHFLEFMSSLHQENAQIMRVLFAYPTINWSLTGMLLDQYYDTIEPGRMLKGLIRSDKTQSSRTFTASVVRKNHQRHSLALKFISMSPETFELLEESIKKGFSS